MAILSLRDVRPIQDFGGLQEAEDVLVETLSAEMYRVVLSSPRFARGTLARPSVRALLSSSRVVRPYRIEHHQGRGDPADVLVVLARDLRDASMLVGVPEWHQLGKLVMVHLENVTEWELRRYIELIATLRKRVDALFTSREMPPLGHLSSARLRTIEVVPPLLDVLAFPAWPQAAHRTIDILSSGAAPRAQDQLLRQWATEHGGNYRQDIGQLGAVTSLAQHRKIFTTMASRSRLFLTNYRRYGRGRGGGYREVGTRFFEAMAAGCVLVGDLPRDSRQFVDYVAPAMPLRFPVNASALPREVVAALADPEHSSLLGTAARAAALRGNDVAHRWREMATLAGLPASPGVEARISQLAALADDLNTAGGLGPDSSGLGSGREWPDGMSFTGADGSASGHGHRDEAFHRS
ncbi:MAG: glycosyltransferase family 1 protein [Pseudonocardia sp.]|nr:glycosyltransferase family 1 protein [Pseudonocardia sp.]